jgi:hypothetical protein
MHEKLVEVADRIVDLAVRAAADSNMAELGGSVAELQRLAGEVWTQMEECHKQDALEMYENICSTSSMYMPYLNEISSATIKRTNVGKL